MHILFVTAYTPSRLAVRPYHFIRALAARGHAISLICGATAADQPALDELRQVCRRVVAVDRGPLSAAWELLRTIPSGLPFATARSSSGSLLYRAVETELHDRQYDVAHLDQLPVSALGCALGRLPTVLDATGCASLLYERTLRGSPRRLRRLLALAALGRSRRYEAAYAERSQRVLVASAEDAWALRVLQQELSGPSGTPAHVVASGVDLDYFAPYLELRERETLVFGGAGAGAPGEAAALLLAQAIMPRVWQMRRDVRLEIVGGAPSRAVRALAADPRIVVAEAGSDPRPALARATLAVAPLRYGAGTQNHVLEALAMGTPVVAARQAAQALAASHGHELLLALTPAEHAEAILALLDDPGYRGQLGRAGRLYVEQHHTWAAAAADLEQIYAAATGAEIADWRLSLGLHRPQQRVAG